MYTVVRRYKDVKLIELLQQRRAVVEEIIRPVPGFVAYYLVKSSDGGVSITVCDDKAGTDASSRAAAEWIRNNVPEAAGSPPEIVEGEAVIQFAR